MMTRISCDDLKCAIKLQDECLEKDLRGSKILSSYPLTVLAKVFLQYKNMKKPAEIERMLKNKQCPFYPAILIHAVRKEESAYEDSFVKAAEELQTNCRRLADLTFRWWSWKRYFWRDRADVMHSSLLELYRVKI